MAWDTNGSMNKKLLNKTTNSFLAFAVIILLISAPVFYFICQWLYIYETDEVLLFHKGAFEIEIRKGFSENNIAAWNKYNRDVEIVAGAGVIKDSIFGKMMLDPISQEMEPYRILYSPIDINGKKFTYIEKNNLVEMEGMIFSIAFMFFSIILILLTGIIWLSKRSSEKIWRPFYDTLNQIHNFEIDKNKPPMFMHTNIDEFERLNKSIEKLIEKNIAIYKSQKEFVENAAHELQTPLALFQTKIDTLSQSAGISKEQSRLIGFLNNDVARMNRLNKNLLLLSKIDNDTYLEKKFVILNDYIEKHLDFFTEQSKSRLITISLKQDNITKINTNPVLAEVFINNLFMNAVRHNVMNGSIVISTTASSLTFTNTGKDEALNTEKLFNRFSKADASAQGNGLGLAIVKKIADLNQWEIYYSFHKNQHRFTVQF